MSEQEDPQIVLLRDLGMVTWRGPNWKQRSKKMARKGELDAAWDEVTASLPTEKHLSGIVSLTMGWNTDREGLSYSASFSPSDNITPHYHVGYYGIEARGRSAPEALTKLAARMRLFRPREVTMTPRRLHRGDNKEGWIFDVPWVRSLGRIVGRSRAA